jgi:hypothetical protein
MRPGADERIRQENRITVSSPDGGDSAQSWTALLATTTPARLYWHLQVPKWP